MMENPNFLWHIDLKRKPTLPFFKKKKKKLERYVILMTMKYIPIFLWSRVFLYVNTYFQVLFISELVITSLSRTFVSRKPIYSSSQSSTVAAHQQRNSLLDFKSSRNEGDYIPSLSVVLSVHQTARLVSRCQSYYWKDIIV